MAATASAQWPAFATKAAMLAEIKRQTEPHVPNPYDLLMRIINTDLTGLSDGDDVLESDFTNLP